MEIARIMCGDAVAKKLAMVPLSNNTIKLCIEELSDDVLQQTIASVKRRRQFSLQLMRQEILATMHSSWCLCDTLTQTT